MKRIDNIIFVILIFCLSICGFWLYQLSQYKLPQVVLEETVPHITTISTFEAPPSQQLVDLPHDRNIFKLPWTEDQMNSEIFEEVTTFQNPHLSTICWIDELPLAIINGEVLKKEDEDSKSQFRVETITRDKVGIRFIGNGEYLWLTLGTEEKDLLLGK
jgi:hypothetical protein